MSKQKSDRTAAKSFPIFQNVAEKNISISDDRTVIKDVVIIQSGYDKTGDFFTKSFINDIVAHGNAQTQGVKARFGHPQMCKTTLGSALGRYKNFRLVKDDSDSKWKAVADLHLLEISKKTSVEGRDISMHDYVVGLAQEDSAMFGNSIVYSWKEGVLREDDEDLPEDYDRTYVQQLKSFVASDVVDSPAATDNIFKDSEDLGVQIAEFMKELPDDQATILIGALENEPTIVKSFLTKFKTIHQKNSTDMKKTSIFQSVKEALFGKNEGAKDFTMTTGDGAVVTIVTDEDRTEPMVGDKVQDSEGNPVADGEHLMQDGSTIVTSGGEITEIRESASGEDEASDDKDKGGEDAEKDLKSFISKQFDSMKADFRSQLAAEVKKREALEKDVKETFGLIAKNLKSQIDVEKGIPGSKEEDETKHDRIVVKKDKAA